MTNETQEKKAAKVAAILRAYDYDSADTQILDLLADILHYAQAMGLEWDELLDRAVRHWREEQAPSCPCGEPCLSDEGLQSDEPRCEACIDRARDFFTNPYDR